MSTITICSSANFYKNVIKIQELLEKNNIKAIIPKNAKVMKRTGDFDPSHYKTWLIDAKNYDKKADLIRSHFKEVEKGDAILVVNNKKHGINNYIGGNVLMEMSLAFYLNKPIYVLNKAPEESTFIEEILGMKPVFLNGNLEKLIKLLN